MRSALQNQRAWTGRGQQSGQYGLQDEGSAPGCTYREAVVAWRYRSRPELQRLRPKSCTRDFCATYGFGGLTQERRYIAGKLEVAPQREAA